MNQSSNCVNYLPADEVLDAFQWSLTALKVKNTIRQDKTKQTNEKESGSYEPSRMQLSLSLYK